MYVPPQAVYLYFGCWTMELDEINKGASYDVEAKVVRASDVIWEAILNDDNGEREVEIIVLSDTEEISTDEPSCYEVSGFEAEVNSAPYTHGHDQY
ncbi:hypothetical protein SASPL_147332 [Salvia splendens]|uniref:Uncharacterized protein n=1 Tax=Salvia splendens TaxID=180675 RepID=A0A8X8Z5R0_SALSN|nr:hypothetical protein SASPL_147332 [Salvia splendens]